MAQRKNDVGIDAGKGICGESNGAILPNRAVWIRKWHVSQILKKLSIPVAHLF